MADLSKWAILEEFLSCGKYPSSMKGKPGLKSNLRVQAQKFEIVNGVLHVKRKDGSRLRVVKDEIERNTILRAVHEGGNSIEAAAAAGHMGRDVMENRILMSSWWPNIRADVVKYKQTCAVCQKSDTKFEKASTSLHPIAVPKKPVEQIGIDMCSIPPSEEGHVGFILAVDYFTKWPEAATVKDKGSLTAAQFIYDSIITRQSCYQVQINDQGRQFVNEVNFHLQRLTGIHQRVTSAYHPQANGLVERGNRTVQQVLLRALGEHHNQWHRALNGVLFSMRTSRQASTGIFIFRCHLLSTIT